MDSDMNLGEEVDHSFFDSDCEGEQVGSCSPGPQARSPSSGNGPHRGSVAEKGRVSRSQRGECGQGAAETYHENTLEDRERPGSSTSSAPPSTSVSPSPPASPSPSSPASNSPSPPTSVSPSPPASSSPLSSSSEKGISFPEEPLQKTTSCPNSSADEAGSSDEGKGEIGAGLQSGPNSQRSVPGKQCSHSRSNEAAHSDPDLDIDGSKLECSSSSSSGKQPLCIPTSQQRAKSSSKSRKGHIKDSCQGKNEDEDAEGTVTDVTPLSSPDSSPVHTVYRCKQPKVKSRRKKSSNKQENISQEIYSSLDTLSFDGEKGQGAQKLWRQREAKSSKVSSKSGSLETKRFDQRHSQKILNDATDLNQLLKAMMHLERRELRKIVADFPTRRYAKNYTFSNEEAKRIDCENQRLLQELTRKATKPAAVRSKTAMPSTVRVYHSTLNRQREQERIERENLDSVQDHPAARIFIQCPIQVPEIQLNHRSLFEQPSH
ncbi:cilia- and flagella-associated protein 97 isoform X2 [Heterodontus francisci]|uniref:cilia- and flagella-associated protein 97 isoform X2 n=1 Tax=Heterodontus francisci TaxID=7792 RepID=UPI00355C6E8C